ncbi:MAG: hypothetical protein PHY23_06955 [Oscillospiraceae bacterium]|nr:hypothetical protein [Oscillospiraceae bacterium]
MKKTRRQILLLLTAAVLTAVLCSCSLFGGNGKIPGSSEIYETYKETVNTLFDRGYEYELDGAQTLSEYNYSLALSGASSLRMTIDRILYLKGEGENFAEVVGAQPYAEWDEVRRVSRNSPYPAFFEGLVYEMQDKKDEAELCYREAQLCDGFTLALKDFLYLKDLKTDVLKALRSEVAELESKIHSRCHNSFEGTMSYLDWLPEYHIEQAETALKSEEPDFSAAFSHYENALAADPYSVNLYACCALTAFYADKSDIALRYIGEGLYLSPEHGGLNVVAAAFYCAAGEMETAQEYLNIAKKDNALSDSMKTLVANTEASLGGAS